MTRKLEEYYLTFLETIPDAGILIDEKGTILAANTVFVDLFGFTLEEVIHSNFKFSNLFNEIYNSSLNNMSEIPYTHFEMLTKMRNRLNIAMTISSIKKTPFRLVIMRNIDDILKVQQQGIAEFFSYLKKNVAIVKFSFLDYGPVPELGIELEILSNPEQTLNMMGVYYMTSIQENVGLYGPFPVTDNPNLLSIVYRYEIDMKNSNYKIADERLEGKVKSLIVLIFDKKLESMFSNRREIRKVLQGIVMQEEYQSSNPEIIEKFLRKIQTSLFQKDFQSENEVRTFEQKVSIINQLTRNISDFESSDQIIEEAANLAEKILDFKFFIAWQMDLSRNALRLITYRGYDNLDIDYIPLNSKSISCRCARTGEIQNIPDVRKDPDYFLGRDEIKSELAVPIYSLSGHNVVGVLNIETEELNGFSSNDEMLLELIAERTAVLMEKEEVEYRFLALANLFDHIKSVDVTDIEKFFSTICSFVQDTYSFKFFSIFIVDEVNKQITMKASIGYDNHSPKMSFPLDSKKGAIVKCIQNNKSFNIGNVKKMPFYRGNEDSINSVLVVPMSINGKVIGALNLKCHLLNAFSKTDQRLLETLSKIVSMLLQQMNLLD